MAQDRRAPGGFAVGEVPPNWPGPELANGTFEGLDLAPEIAAGCADGVPGRCYPPVRPASAGQDVAERELGSPGEGKR
jgi:hypothetical protein